MLAAPPAAKPEDMKQTRLLIEAVCAFCGVTPLPVLAESGILLPQPARANRKSSGGPGTDLGEGQLLQDEHETRVAVPGRFSAAGPNRRRPCRTRRRGRAAPGLPLQRPQPVRRTPSAPRRWWRSVSGEIP